MMQWVLPNYLFLGLGLCLLLSSNVFAQDYAEKRVFILHSYNEQYPWTHKINESIRDVLNAKDIVSDTFYLDTKNHASEPEKLASAQMAKLQITKFKPDVVITSDDDAVKYVLMPYYKDSTLPFVFCGVNWDASIYGLPYKNATGMLEIELINEIVKNLQEYAKGRRLGTLALDGFTERKWVGHYGEYLGRAIDKSYFPNTFEEWKDNFLRLQNEVDMVILLNPKGVKDFNMQQAQNFVENNIKVPTGSSIPWMSQMSLLGISLVPEEQGLWAAQAALAILGGRAPSNIPIVRNRQGRLFINLRIAEKLSITFKPYLLKIGEIIR
ncbi:MAG: hypothetical protein RL368_1854 [Pseudomonadota bacterium]|jgi:ABC-type uncharacterized transport system substrate-binding protein